MENIPAIPALVQQKLDAFTQLQPEFERCFQFLQQVHGQKRLSTFTLADCVYYLHARWVCECKGRLLSVPRTVKENDGRRSLELLLMWQEQQDTASIVKFLYEKLDMLPIAEITQQIQEAHRTSQEIARLEHGRSVMLHRGMHLALALDALFALSEDARIQAVTAACTQLGHLPMQIRQQLELSGTPLYSYFPHQALAQRNMLVMNALGVAVTSQPADRPGRRSQKVAAPQEVLPPYAEELIEGYQDMTSVLYNNVNGDRFVDPPAHS